MRVIFNNQQSLVALLEMIDQWATQYGIENYTTNKDRYTFALEFSNPAHITIFALTWSDFLSEFRNVIYSYYLERYTII